MFYCALAKIEQLIAPTVRESAGTRLLMLGPPDGGPSHCETASSVQEQPHDGRWRIRVCITKVAVHTGWRQVGGKIKLLNGLLQGNVFTVHGKSKQKFLQRLIINTSQFLVLYFQAQLFLGEELQFLFVQKRIRVFTYLLINVEKNLEGHL